MKKLLNLFIAVVMFSSCETIQGLDGMIHNRNENIDIELQKFIDIYYLEADLRGVNPNPRNKTFSFTIKENLSNDKRHGVVGLSKHEGFKTHVDMFIDLDVYLSSQETGQWHFVEATVMHELGHGLLNQKHGDSKIVTISNPYAVEYATNKKSLLDDFFK